MTPDEQMTMSVLLLLACLLVLIWVFLRRSRPKPKQSPFTSGPQKWVIIDGSNVMYWKDGAPRIDTVRKVIDVLVRNGFTPGVMFDANAGYHLIGKYQHDDALSRALGLPQDHVMVVPKGTPADPAILTAARDFKARVVTNDRFRDWAQDFPEIRTPGHLIRGSFRSGNLLLELSHSKRGKKTRKQRSKK